VKVNAACERKKTAGKSQCQPKREFRKLLFQLQSGHGKKNIERQG
jgi:hypothetical protein